MLQSVRGMLGSRPSARADFGGIEGGAVPPLVSLRVIHGVCWLVHLSVAKPATRGTRENIPPGIARNSLGRTIVGKLPGLLAATLTDNEGVGGAPCRAAVFGPTSTPRRPEIVRQSRSCGP